MSAQELIIAVLFLAAIVYLALTIRKSLKGKSNCSDGSCNCKPTKH